MPSLLLASLLVAASHGQTGGPPQPDPLLPTPDFSEVAYGQHAGQRFDIYRPKGEAPAPFVMFIHGGGWVNGDKRKNFERIRRPLVDAGVAVVSVNYRFLKQAAAEGVSPPVLGPLADCARALQTLRHRAAEFGLDPERVALMGESAGAFTALWIGLGDERAEPGATDPIAQMSTRVRAIGVNDAQTSIDPAQMRKWVGPELTYGPHAFGLPNNAKGFEDFLRRREEFAPLLAKISPAALLSPDDPPAFLFYGRGLTPVEPLTPYYTHSPRFGIGFKTEADRRNVACTVSYTDMENRPKGSTTDFLIKALWR